jgi:diadenylate cyclase
LLNRNQALIEGAVVVARRSGADAVILAGWLPQEREQLERALPDVRVISTANPVHEISDQDAEVLVLPQLRLRRRGRAKVALLEGLASGMLNPGERVVVISGDVAREECELDTIAVVDLTDNERFLDGQAGAALSVLREVADPATFDALLTLCVEMGHDGREGKPVGLLVTLGDVAQVLQRSRPLVLNPFEGHPESMRSILAPAARRAMLEFSAMDGAFLLRSDGVIVAAGRYLQDVGPATSVPSGLGTRHRAAAGITATTRCIAFCVSESTGDTRVFGGGHLLMTIQRND